MAFIGKFSAQKPPPTHFSYLLDLPPLLSCCLFSAVAKLILKYKITKDIKERQLVFFILPLKSVFEHTLMTLEITMYKQEQHSYKQCKLKKIF